MNLPDGWVKNTYGWRGGGARAYITEMDKGVYAEMVGPTRPSTAEAERDLERMVWALEGEDIAMVRADRDASLARVVALETWNAALSAEVEKARNQARLTEQALTAARREISDLRSAAQRRDARERRPVLRRVVDALLILRGIE